jgi:hypothetical protein
MIIMQTDDAPARRQKIEEKGLGKVIFAHETEHSHCIQYHPKGVPGGVMPELDSHKPDSPQPSPLNEAFTPWHACGPDYNSYIPIMRRHSDLSLVGCALRLKEGQVDVEAAARTWRDTFGVPMDRALLAFTNARMGFVRGVAGKSEGLDNITVAVRRRSRFEGILARAREEGLCGQGWVNMCGLKWYFVCSGEQEADVGVKEKL